MKNQTGRKSRASNNSFGLMDLHNYSLAKRAGIKNNFELLPARLLSIKGFAKPEILYWPAFQRRGNPTESN